ALPAPLAIVSPGNGSILAADGEGAAQPRLALTCSGAHGAVWWFADGDLLGQAPADQPCWWLAPGGRHDLRVVDASGRAASVRILVR
ncbi:MAG: penicillin-binding protein 1C, partial [Planctomycetes bacterium]|nr:penicillin-binding protein 1C [Planctomycetota bacterium]